MTLLQSAEWLRPYRIEKLRRLRGEDLPPPTFEPRFRPSRLDRLLGKRGVPIAPFGAAFQDGRVALLLCACGDLDCPTLSANVVVNDATVEWRDVGWQVSYEPFEAQDVVREQPHMTFERSAYEALVADLLGDSI